MGKKKEGLGTNEFYDISKFPKQQGICVIGVSIPKIDKGQSPKKLFDSSMHLMPKIKKSGVGDIICYSDGLYMNSNKPASELKMKFQRLMEEHKRGYLKLLKKDIYLITSAYSFTTWSQLILNCSEFHNHFEKIKKVYEKDKLFQKYVKLDIISAKKRIIENNINYILEEVLLDYLVAMGKVRLQNDFVQDKQKWILNCYNGKPHRSHVYIYKKNPFSLESKNVYKDGWYDLEAKKLYSFERLDIDAFDFS